MALYLDSAIADEARRAWDLGLVVGVTTNPALVAKAGRPALDIIRDLARIGEWDVFHQLTGRTADALLDEARRASDIAPGQVVLKIMVSLPNLELVARHGEFRWAVTGIGSAAQGLLALEAGADYVIPYVNRITRGGGDGIRAVADIAALAETVDDPGDILAASLKSPEEVADVLLAGADHVTVPWALLEEMARHPVTDAADEDFRRALGLA
ncbi:MAG: transaldolase family protein [Anaerolineae bacterium]|jgi:transaldolase|nr:transaldolase family protein [Anaerolineae bacterium]